MTKLILTRGIPASGKSTWAKAWVAADPDHRFRSNRDDLRVLLGIQNGRGSHADEEQVTYWQQRMVQYAIESGKDAVVDDTNLRARYAKEWLRIAASLGATVEFVDFPVALEEAIHRDRNRAAMVGRDVVADFYRRYTPKGVLPPVPTLDDEPGAVKFPLYVPPTDPEAPHAILVDIDGTLAHMTGRSPFDRTLYHTDAFDETIAKLAYIWAETLGAYTIVVSGRDGDHRPETEAWLNRYGFEHDEFYMRPAGDTRNDAIVKNELFERYIAGRFHIDFVLDDRDRVVQMWRAKGLKTLQVADGNF